MTRRGSHISDHAMLRYLERVVGIDIETHRREVERKVARAVELQATGLISDGFQYVISDFCVTTVMRASSVRRMPQDKSAEDEGGTRAR